MKLNSTIKFIILILIILISLCLLYFCSTSIKEGLDNKKCTTCKVKPNEGNCIQIKDLSYANYEEDIQLIDFDVIDTSYVFCPWTPNCNYLDNIISESERLKLSKENIQSGIKDNIDCCLETDNNFYKNNTLDLYEIPQFKHIKDICSKINERDNTITNIKANRVGNEYLKLRNLCNEADLKGLYFTKSSIDTDNETKDTYSLVNNKAEPVGETYILQKDEFFNCFGEKVKTSKKNFSLTDIDKFESENFFDVDSKASYTTVQDNKQRPYPSKEDFDMELKNLPPIQQSDNIPASVINTYLNTINSFYEKQISNMIGPRTHAVPQTLEFDNDSLTTKPSTFFVYDGSINTNFDCEPSVTGNNKFKYCGPASYYTEFKP